MHQTKISQLYYVQNHNGVGCDSTPRPWRFTIVMTICIYQLLIRSPTFGGANCMAQFISDPALRPIAHISSSVHRYLSLFQNKSISLRTFDLCYRGL